MAEHGRRHDDKAVEIAGNIVDLLEAKDPAFGYAEGLPGQENREQWIDSIAEYLTNDRYDWVVETLRALGNDAREEADTLLAAAQDYRDTHILESLAERYPQVAEDADIRLYVANLGKYNEGSLVGEWISLPIDEDSFAAMLERIGIGGQYEETAIHDFEAPDGLKIGEYDSIADLNMLAIRLEEMDESEKELALGYCSDNHIVDPLGILNVCYQVEDFSYVQLPDMSGSDEERLGYALIEEINTNIKDALEECKLGSGLTAYSYFDFEKYGRDCSINDGFFIGDKFLFYGADPDVSYYSRDELRDMQDSHAKAWTMNKAEEMVEENYNQIDGVISNTPTSKLAEIKAMGEDNRGGAEDKNREAKRALDELDR